MSCRYFPYMDVSPTPLISQLMKYRKEPILGREPLSKKFFNFVFPKEKKSYFWIKDNFWKNL